MAPQDITCHLDMTPDHCATALKDANKLAVIFALLMPLCQLTTLPIVGVISDAIGRKKTLFIVFAFANLALLFTDMFIWFNFTYWGAIAVTPFLNDQVTSTVLNSCVVDILPEAERSAGMGLVTALDTIAYLAGLAIGYNLTLRSTFALASIFCVVALVYIVFLFPETLPPEKRKFKPDVHSIMPWHTLPILWRTKLIWRLSVVMGISAFLDLGSLLRALPMYYQLKLNWTASNGYIFEMCLDSSMIVWFMLIFHKMINSLGEVGVLAFGRLAGLLYIIPGVLLVAQPWQAFINIGIWAGPLSFALPAIAGLKSRLVDESEQGRMQAALSTVYIVCGSLGQVVFGALFDSLGEKDTLVALGWSIIIPNVVGAAICFWMFYDLRKQVQDFLTARTQGDLNGALAPGAGFLLEKSPEAAQNRSYGSTAIP